MHDFPETECFVGTHIAHFVFGCLGLVLTSMFGFLISVCFVENFPSVRLKCARLPGIFEKSKVGLKLLLVIGFEMISIRVEHVKWTSFVISAVFSLLNFIIIIYEKPYFSKKTLKVVILSSLFMIYGSFSLLVSMLASSYNFKEGFYVLVTGELLLSALIAVYSIKQEEVIIMKKDRINDEITNIRKIMGLLYLLEFKSVRENSLLLKGYLLTMAKDDLVNNSDIEEVTKMIKADSSMANKKVLYHFFAYIEQLFKQSLIKFPHSNKLKFYFLYFKFTYFKDIQTSLVLLKKITQSSPSIEEEFIVFRYYKMIESTLTHSGHAEAHNDVFTRRYKNMFYSTVEKTADGISMFWEQVTREEKSISCILVLIHNTIDKLEKFSSVWKSLIRLRVHDKQINSVYEYFFKYVLNEEVSTEDLRNETSFANSTVVDKIIKENEELMNDGSAYCVGTLRRDKLIIQKYNLSFLNLFGYLKEDMFDAQVDLLLPELMRQRHEEVVSKKINSINSESAFIRRSSMGITKGGYVFPINLTLITINSLEGDKKILAFMRQNNSDFYKEDTCHLILDLNYNIRHVSSHAIYKFGLNNVNLKLTRGEHFQYMHIYHLIPLFKEAVFNKEIMDIYSPENKDEKAKLIKVVKTQIFTDFLRESNLQNRTIQVEEEIDTSGLSLDQTEKSFTEDLFYMNVEPLQIGPFMQGYIVSLKARQEDIELPLVRVGNDDIWFDGTTKQFCSPDNFRKVTEDFGEKEEEVDATAKFIREHQIRDYSVGVMDMHVDIKNRMFFLKDDTQMKIREVIYEYENSFKHNITSVKEEIKKTVNRNEWSFKLESAIELGNIIRKLKKGKSELLMDIFSFFSFVLFLTVVANNFYFYFRDSGIASNLKDAFDIRKNTIVLDYYLISQAQLAISFANKGVKMNQLDFQTEVQGYSAKIREMQFNLKSVYSITSEEYFYFQETEFRHFLKDSTSTSKIRFIDLVEAVFE